MDLGNIMRNKIILYQYNILSLLNVISGFIFTLSIMKYFGNSKVVDTFFTTILVFMNINILIGFIYASFFPHFLKLKNIDIYKAINYYKMTILLIIFTSIIVVILYQIFFIFINNENFIFNIYTQKYIYILLLFGVFETNNFLINANQSYKTPYFLLIFINLLNFLGILVFHNFGMMSIIYTTFLGYLISVIIQFIFIHKKLNLQQKFYFDMILIKQVIKDSFTIKLSSAINGITDIVIVSLFTSMGTGFYSIYSYARKFSLAIYNIANGPIIKKFNTEIANLVLDKQYSYIVTKAKNTFLKIAPIFILGEVITYSLLPTILSLISDKFSLKDIKIMQSMFILLSLFYLLLIIEYIFVAIISQFHAFKYTLWINIIYAIFFTLISFPIYNIYPNYLIILGFLVMVLFINLILEYHVIKKILFKEKSI